MLTRMWNNWDFHSLLVEIQNGTYTLEGFLSLAVSKRQNTLLTYDLAVSWYLPKRTENVCLHKNLHTDLYSNFIQNCQHLEATKMTAMV